ncbi:hypothetical protein Q5P01_025265 [Channa striata]|uniref:Uncharacterized protein n=1 Tax=Channa striata TaxID=64152 RepID=A0AA88J1P5_CHASR|nr:hypothetical protein Q5P01_025265 [Channa striata]
MMKIVFVLGCLLCLTLANPIDNEAHKRLERSSEVHQLLSLLHESHPADESTVVPVFAHPAPDANYDYCYYNTHDYNYYHCQTLKYLSPGLKLFTHSPSEKEPVYESKENHYEGITTDHPCVNGDTMLKVAFVLGCLLCLTLAKPFDDKAPKRPESKRRPIPPLNLDPALTSQLLQILRNLLRAQQLVTPTPSPTTTAATEANCHHYYGRHSDSGERGYLYPVFWPQLIRPQPFFPLWPLFPGLLPQPPPAPATPPPPAPATIPPPGPQTQTPRGDNR